MPLELAHGRSVILIRQQAYENAGLIRYAVDERYNLAPNEFAVQEGLVILGPLPSDELLPSVIDDLEQSGLVYFDDFFEMSGNWPDWLALYARNAQFPPS
jgi:hypothetical protein